MLKKLRSYPFQTAIVKWYSMDGSLYCIKKDKFGRYIWNVATDVASQALTDRVLKSIPEAVILEMNPDELINDTPQYRNAELRILRVGVRVVFKIILVYVCLYIMSSIR